MKKTLKDTMVETLVNNGAKLNAETGKYEMTVAQLNAARVEIQDLGKFTVKHNNKDATLFAVAYTTRASENLVVIKTVEVQPTKQPKAPKAPKAPKQPKAHVSFQMLPDKGLDHHVAAVKLSDKSLADKLVAAVKTIAAGMDHISDAIVAKMDEASDVIELDFPKVEKHSKDGYSSYKKCITLAKKQLLA